MNLVGSGQNPMLNMLIQPLVDQIAQKLGIPDTLAMAAVTFAIHYLPLLFPLVVLHTS